MEQLREKIDSLLKHLIRERIGLIIQSVNRRFSENVVKHISDFYIWPAFLCFMVALLTFVVVYSARSYGDLVFALSFTVYALLFVIIPIMIFELLYFPRKVISHLRSYSSIVQYEVLAISRKPVWISFLSLPFLVVVIALPRFATVESFGELVGNAIAPKIFFMFTAIGFLLMCWSIPASFVFMLKKDEDLELSVGLIQNVERIASGDGKRGHKRQDGLADIWMYLMRIVFDKCKKTLEKQTGACQIDLQQPFGVISLAFIIGNKEQKKKVKEWVSQIGTILTDKRLAKATKSEKLLKQLDMVGLEKQFPDALNQYRKMGFRYQFEPVWGSSGWRVKALSIAINVVLTVLTVVQLLK